MTKIALGMVAAILLQPQAKPEPKIPEELKKVFDGLMKAFEAADGKKIQSFALEGAVSITADERKDNREYGADINLPFLKKGFSGKIEKAIEKEDGTYLIRTSTSGFNFVLYRNQWRLFRYGDKPIE